MPSRTPYYSDFNPPNEDQSYWGSMRARNGHNSDTMPLRHISSSTGSGDVAIMPAKKRIGNLEVTNPMEQESLLDPGPVRLAPCWESRHAPSDELSFKSHFHKGDIDLKPPVDRFNLVFLIFLLHGIGILMPWNMFITAKSYFVDYKLKVNDTSDSTEEYRKHFLLYVGVSSQVPNVICSGLNIFVQFGGGSLTFRVIGSLLIEIVVFILTVLLAMLDSSTWAGAFFYITMASVVVLNMANGIYQNSLYGLAANLPMKYSMAIVLGSNTSGTFASLISILSIAASPNKRTAAIYYFITALFVLLACVDTYFLLPLTRFYRYYDTNQQALTDTRRKPQRPPYWKVFRKAFPQCLNVFMVFFVTLSIFPAIHADIQPIDKDFIIPDKYFSPVTCFLCFNFFAMIGSLIPNWIKWPGPRFLWIPVALRFLMIPFFMLCNYHPDKRTIPVFITNDWAYIAMGVALGLTSGYYSSLGMMYAPGCVEKEHAPVAGMMAALFLVSGIFCGVNFTFFLSWLVESDLFKF